MKILVTGGAGFIGSNFLYYLRKKRPTYQLVCLDALTYAGNLKTLEPLLEKNEIKFIRGDITDRTFIFELFEKEKFDYVVNFAAESHVDRSISNPGIFLTTNILGVQNLLDACRKFGIIRYHQVSTDEVYGDLPLNRPDLLFTEETPLHTSSPYSASKASADLLVLAYNRTFKLPVTISRCSNNYGPYHFPEKLIPLMISKALNDQPLPIYGDGKNIRDWLYVEDHCVAIDLVLHDGRDGQVYNIGGNNEKSNLEIVKIILSELNKPESLITYVKDRAGHDLRYAIDPTKTINEFGWQPTTGFDVGIKKTIKWYLENREWWEKILDGSYANYYEEKIIIPSMKVLVTGGLGQLGSDVVAMFKRKNVECKGIDIDDLDITDENSVNKFIKEYNPTHIIHCAAYTAVDNAEGDREKAFSVNVLGTRYLAIAAQEYNSEFLYISTDYVFDGTGITPFKVTDQPNPKNFYGLTKFQGEIETQRNVDKNYIVRISWVFGTSGNNFVKTMLRLSEQKDNISVVSDQIGSPTYTYDLAEAIYTLIKNKSYGTHHITNEGYCSWAEFATEIFNLSKKKVDVKPISSEEYQTVAKRPKNSRMEKNSVHLRHWKEALKHYFAEIKNQK